MLDANDAQTSLHPMPLQRLDSRKWVINMDASSEENRMVSSAKRRQLIEMDD